MKQDFTGIRQPTKENPFPVAEVAELRGAFNESIIAELTPVVQMRATYDRTSQYEIFGSLGGSAGSSDGNFFTTCAASAGSAKALTTKRSLIYNSGQGALGRFTALYDTPAAGNIQEAGLIAVNDIITFGYNGIVFGIFIDVHGTSEVQKLTFTGGAGGSEDATVTIDGTIYTIPLTAGTTAHNAKEVVNFMATKDLLWEFDSNGADVVAIDLAVDNGTVGTFAFSSSTAVASWSQSQARVARTPQFIAEADWSEKPNGLGNDRTKGNVFAISFQYLGYGAVGFFEESKATGRYVLVHIYSPVGDRILPTMRNPSFRIGWSSTNLTNTTAITVKGGSVAGFIEGFRVNTDESQGYTHTQTGVTTTLTNILSLRSRYEFNGLRNFGEILLQIVGISSDSTKPIEVSIIKNPIFATTLEYANADTNESISQISTSSVEVTGGVVIASGAGDAIDLAALNQILIAGDEVTIAANITSGANSAITASMSTFEDL